MIGDGLPSNRGHVKKLILTARIEDGGLGPSYEDVKIQGNS